MLAKNLFDFLPHRSCKQKKERRQQRYIYICIGNSQSIKWLLLSWHDSNDDKDDISTLTIYNMQKRKSLLHRKNMTGEVVVIIIILLLMCVHAIVCV